MHHGFDSKAVIVATVLSEFIPQTFISLQQLFSQANKQDRTGDYTRPVIVAHIADVIMNCTCGYKQVPWLHTLNFIKC